MEQRSSNLEPGDTLSEIYCYQRMWTVLLEATSIMRYSKLYIIIIIIIILVILGMDLWSERVL